ncbi:methyl-accepting chemotaxis protein [Bacillus suaedae]|uniref:Methyl-accepting chemotaxis protein n=1 Tax=Halalkalibacter suaedae TaxID=2822140 RepID=A0A940WQX3_9BACI|nr:methyl-accepting chemotaxis protein [Bacillus suaedae]MBP3950870.1 methyl-accepting chemotaxis protein [Bacillus suaedae]
MKALTNWTHFSLRLRLIIMFVIVLFWLAVINCVFIFVFFGYVREYNGMMTTITLTNSINGELKQQLDEEIRDIVYGKISFDKGSQYTLLTTMNNHLDQIERDDPLMLFKEEINNVRESLVTTKEYIDQLGEEIKFNVPAEKRNITYEYITIITDIVDDEVQELLHSTLQVSEQSKKNINENIKRDIIFYILIFIAIIIVTIVFAWLISSNMVKPIHRLRKNANEIARGNLTVDAIVLPSKNEIGDLCRSYNHMSNNLKDIILNVRSTNDLVTLSSNDIHQSIKENRKAGEEIANASQTISLNLHQQDELVKQAVSTFDEVILNFEGILVKTKQMQLYSNKTMPIANQGNTDLNDLLQQMKTIHQTIQDIQQERTERNHYVYQIEKQINILKLIGLEANLLSVTVSNENTETDDRTNLISISRRIQQLATEANDAFLLSNTNAPDLHQHTQMINEKINLVENQLMNNELVINLKDHFSSIHSINSYVQSMLNTVTDEMQKSFEDMDRIRNLIREIENRSNISKSEVVSIAAMGEEQLTTLEEVSEASYKLVERIQQLKENIRRFKV